MVLKRTEMFVFAATHYARSPRIRLANWISSGHDGDPPGMYSTQVSVFKQTD